MTEGLEAAVHLLLAFALVWVGKLVYGLFTPAARIDREVTARDNPAFAVPLGAYYLGILIVMGAPLSGPRGVSLARDVAAVAGWGLLAIVLLNVAAVANRALLFRGLDLRVEILERRNVAAGYLAGGSHLANALLVLGALGDEGGFLPAAVFWLYAQLLLFVAARTFLGLVRYDLPAEIGRGNQAVGLTVAGLLVALGNVLRLAVTGPFEGWSAAFAATTGYALAGLVVLFAARWLTDWLLLPGVTIRQEVVEQAEPNVGVGWLEAVFYVGASLLVGWAL
jgi:uncharacterized membrane protein YjfL (UPF0719 family)